MSLSTPSIIQSVTYSTFEPCTNSAAQTPHAYGYSKSLPVTQQQLTFHTKTFLLTPQQRDTYADLLDAYTDQPFIMKGVADTLLAEGAALRADKGHVKLQADQNNVAVQVEYDFDDQNQCTQKRLYTIKQKEDDQWVKTLNSLTYYDPAMKIACIYSVHTEYGKSEFYNWRRSKVSRFPMNELLHAQFYEILSAGTTPTGDQDIELKRGCFDFLDGLANSMYISKRDDSVVMEYIGAATTSGVAYTKQDAVNMNMDAILAPDYQGDAEIMAFRPYLQAAQTFFAEARHLVDDPRRATPELLKNVPGMTVFL